MSRKKKIRAMSRDKKAKASAARKYIEHVDKEWIMEKIGGHGGSYSYDRPDGIVRIGYIGSIGKMKIRFYNFLLFIRFLKRKIAERRAGIRR